MSKNIVSWVNYQPTSSVRSFVHLFIHSDSIILNYHLIYHMTQHPYRNSNHRFNRTPTLPKCAAYVGSSAGFETHPLCVIRACASLHPLGWGSGVDYRELCTLIRIKVTHATRAHPHIISEHCIRCAHVYAVMAIDDVLGFVKLLHVNSLHIIFT